MSGAIIPASATVQDKTLIFLHIPKTAGTTLNRIIESQYSPWAIYTIDPHRIRATPERLTRLPEARRRRLRVVRGHFFYGIHECLPQGATYITMLRDPVARVLSAYHFILRRPLNPLHRKLKRERLTVQDCLRLFPQRHNLQCRLLSGIQDSSIKDEQLLETAKKNLITSFKVVGVSERFEESLSLMAQAFGWRIRFYENRKVAKNRPVVDPQLAKTIREHEYLDVELYEFGKNLFEEALQQKQDEVRKRVAALRALRRPGPMKRFLLSNTTVARFILNKILSAI